MKNTQELLEWMLWREVMFGRVDSTKKMKIRLNHVCSAKRPSQLKLLYHFTLGTGQPPPGKGSTLISLDHSWEWHFWLLWMHTWSGQKLLKCRPLLLQRPLKLSKSCSQNTGCRKCLYQIKDPNSPLVSLNIPWRPMVLNEHRTILCQMDWLKGLFWHTFKRATYVWRLEARMDKQLACLSFYWVTACLHMQLLV